MTSGTSYSPPPAFGRFKLLHQIGAGVLGPVFRTHDPDADRLVAVKAFTLDLTPERASALAAELQRVADLELDDACIAAPLAAGVEDFVPYVAAPYVSGESLDAAIRQYGPAPPGDAIRLITHVAEALDVAAHVGVFHGSLHTRDVIVTPGETHVTGLGIAQALERVGQHGPIRRPYVAPERESGDEWGAPADIYSLAAIAYEVLTGRRALPGTDQPLPALSDLRVHDAAALREVLESALDADPERRPARAREFATAFAAALSESAGPAATAERALEKRARKPRGKSPKLPGIDEPLIVQAEAPGERARAEAKAVEREVAATAPVPVPEAPVASPVPVAGTAPVQEVARPERGTPAGGDLRYVPVLDSVDAGDAATELPPISLSLPDVTAESETPPREPITLPASFEPIGAPHVPGPTPDLRLADQLVPRADAAGESVDAELAAALDRMAAGHGSGPTPSSIGIDIFAPTPQAVARPEDLAAPDLALEIAPKRAQAAREPIEFEVPASSSTAQAEVDRPQGEPLAIDFGAPAGPKGPYEKPAEAKIDVSAVAPAASASEPPSAPAAATTPEAEAEEESPAAPGRPPGRRRTPFRPIRPVPPVSPPQLDAEKPPDVPRALEPTRSTPAPRSFPDFELLARTSESHRPPVLPVVIGVAAGLVLGLAGGYWLGSRGAAPGAAAPAQAAMSSRQVPAPPGLPAALPESAPAKPEGAAPRPSETPATERPAPSARQAAGEPAAAPPSVSEGASTPVAAAAAKKGTIRITASQQTFVYLDGKRVGLTPRTLTDVPLGSHTIRVTRSGYPPQERTVQLTAEQATASLNFTIGAPAAAPPAGAPAAAPAPAIKSVLTVFVESTPPGAMIRVDGRELTVTPLMIRQMRPGTHKIELRLAGYRPWSTTITVAAGDDRRLSATLERDTTR